jgi:hypothetical protein
MACLVYSEQLGEKRQLAGSQQRMYLWYIFRKLIPRFLNIKLKSFFFLFGGGGVELFFLI